MDVEVGLVGWSRGRLANRSGPVGSAHRVGAHRFVCWAARSASAARLMASAIADWPIRSPAAPRALRTSKAAWADSCSSVIEPLLFSGIAQLFLRPLESVAPPASGVRALV